VPSRDRSKYGAHHQELRRWWVPYVAVGDVPCAECGERIRPHDRWDLGHTPNAGPQDYRGPLHRACNRSTTWRDGERTAPVGDPEPGIRDPWWLEPEPEPDA
jgi:hypothetical protein